MAQTQEVDQTQVQGTQIQETQDTQLSDSLLQDAQPHSDPEQEPEETPKAKGKAKAKAKAGKGVLSMRQQKLAAILDDSVQIVKAGWVFTLSERL